MKTWKDDEKFAFEVWKYYGATGGADKDTMIKIVTWLLAFSSTIIGAIATGKLTKELPIILLLVIGSFVSFLAAMTALLYGGYATWNWSIADRIAEAYDWKQQRPDFPAIPKRHWTARIPLRLAQPCDGKIAPVFWLFSIVSLISCIVHIVLLYYVFHYGIEIVASAA